MRRSTTAAMLAAASVYVAAALPALAQIEPGASSGEGQAILVTGSRIRRSTFESAAPVDVIDKQDAVLAGENSMAALLQSDAITSGTGQINESFVGFVSEGGPGANTVGLRGLGARRTLVLLNGRRLAPAGAGPELVAADLNVLPLAVLERVEVLRDGASAVYGSDAVAGVINVKTRMRLNGAIIDAYAQQPIEGHGETHRLSAVAGRSGEWGHFTAAIEYRRQRGLRVRDREDFTCPQDGFTDVQTGQPVGQLIRGTSELRCFPFEGVYNGYAQNYIIGTKLATKAVDRLGYRDGSIGAIEVINDHDLRPAHHPRELDPHVIRPLKTLTGYLNGAFRFAPDSELYGEFLHTARQSQHAYVSQIGVLPAEVDRLFMGGRLLGLPLDRLGIAVSPFFPAAAAAAGYNELKFFIVPPMQTASRNVDFYRGNAGVRGEFGQRAWRYDLNVQYSRTEARYTNQIIDRRNLNAALKPVIAPAGTPETNTVTALAGQAGAGRSYTCAANLDAAGAFIPGSACVPFNPFDPAVLAGDVPQHLFDFLFAETLGRTRYAQWTAQAVVDGPLFALPGGEAAFAAGLEYRRDFIQDVPDEAARTGNLYGYPATGITTGSDTVREAFAELALPLLAERPLAHLLRLSGSARYTDYRSYSPHLTYHIGAEYAPVPALRFRGRYGTSFRAPNLFEQHVADQAGFSGYDPCNDFAHRSSAGEPLFANCRSELGGLLNNDSNGDGIRDNWVQSGSAKTVRRGGAGSLEAEKSTSWGGGAVLRLAAATSEFSLAADYFNLTVKGEVGTLGPAILDRCYKSSEFRAGNLYCGFVGPRDLANRGNLVSFEDPHLNIASQSAEGVDFNAFAAAAVPGGRVAATLHATRMLSQTFQPFAELAPQQLNGRLGNHGKSGGPKLTGQFDVRFTTADAAWTLRYGVKYTGRMDSGSDLAPISFRGTKVNADLVAEPYWEHGVSVQYAWDGMGQVTLGVNNLLNADPPVIGSHGSGVNDRRPTIGNYFNYSTYDFLGRSVFLNVTREF